MEFLIVIGVIAAIVINRIARQNNGRINDAWSSAATKLGLDFTRASPFKAKSIRGMFQGNDVEISTYSRSAGKARKTYTRYRVHYPERLGLGLSVTESNMFKGLSKVFGAQDIETGDIDFDSRVVVKGKNLYRVATFLDAGRRREILDLFDRFPGCEIGDTTIEWSQKGTADDSSEIAETALVLTTAATAIFEGDEPSAADLVEPAPASNTKPMAAPIAAIDAATTAGAADSGPDAVSVCTKLFAPSVMSFEAGRLFDEKYRDTMINWHGTLKSVTPYRIDLTFRGGPGTKATFDLAALDGALGGRTIHVVLQLPPATDHTLNGMIGKTLGFQGRLARCEPLVRTFHVADGQLA